jgi:serine/threonine protein kinase
MQVDAMMPQGTKVVGKWTNTVLYVEQHLGSGANGQVYLVRSPAGRAAMKVCPSSSDIAMEWGLLEKLSARSSVFPKPMFIDDCAPDLYFYVMEWIAGEPFHRAAKNLSPTQFHDVVGALLAGFAELHATGHGFCDIKPENILVSATTPPSIRFVDVGGVTQFGRSVRQYTPFYDRGFWGLGSRKADASYDLCGVALAVLFTSVQPPDVLLGKSPEQRKEWLWKALRKFPSASYVPLIQRVLRGEVLDALQFQREWARAGSATARSSKNVRAASAAHPPSRSTSAATGKHRAAPSRRLHRQVDWTEWLMWTSLGMAVMVTMTAWASFLGLL